MECWKNGIMDDALTIAMYWNNGTLENWANGIIQVKE